jgi:hypothetical protein
MAAGHTADVLLLSLSFSTTHPVGQHSTFTLALKSC